MQKSHRHAAITKAFEASLPDGSQGRLEQHQLLRPDSCLNNDFYELPTLSISSMAPPDLVGEDFVVFPKR